MTPETEQQYKNQIAALQAEIEKLRNQQTKAERLLNYKRHSAFNSIFIAFSMCRFSKPLPIR